MVTIGRALAFGALALTDVLLIGLGLVAAVLTGLGLVFVFPPWSGWSDTARRSPGG